MHAMRRGMGTALLTAAERMAEKTRARNLWLTTYRHLPWNAPFYARLGFRVMDELSPDLQAIRDHEREIGDDDFGPRVAMHKDLA